MVPCTCPERREFDGTKRARGYGRRETRSGRLELNYDGPATGVARMTATHTNARSRLDVVVMRGFLWTSGGRLIVQLATWVVSLTIARILSPRDYGIAAMAALYIGFAQLLAELGIGAAIVQRTNLPKPLVASLTGVSLVMGVVLALVSVPAGYALAAFYKEPILVAVVAVYGLNFIPTAFRSVSAALLSKEMAFGKVTMLALIEAVSASLISLMLALAGWSVWALVLGNVAAVSLAALVAVMWAPPGFSLDVGRLRGTGVLTFGYKVLVQRSAWYLYASTDFLIIGRLIGTAALGQYNLAYQFASIPAERITGALTQVLFPVFATLQRNAVELARYFRHATEACMLVLMPVYIGLALVAFDLIDVALGVKWRGAAPIVVVLALAAVVRAAASVANTAIISAGNAGFGARMSVIGLIVFPPSFLIASQTRWGAAAVGAVWLLLYPPVIAIPTIAVALRYTSMSVAEYFGAIKPALWSTLVMAMAVYAVQQATAEANTLLRLAFAVATGAATYGVMLLVFFRDRVQRYVSLASRGVGSGGGEGARALGETA